MKDFFDKLSRYSNIRLVIMFIVIVLLFCTLVVKLFVLQILNGEYYNSKVKGTTLKEITIPAPRGTIYDRYGRPLAVNSSSFTVNLDASVNVDNLNEVIFNLINLLEENGEEIIDEFPISKEKPFTFLLDGSETREKRWKRDMGLKDTLTAEASFYQLRKKFELDDKYTDEQARKILSLRCELYKKRYSKYIPITVAYDIKSETIADIEEQKSNYPSVYIDVESLRRYPQGKFFSHILGYIRVITTEELTSYKKYGYTLNDIVGKDGIEKSFELELNGTDGKSFVEVDSVGRRVNTIESETIDPIPGNKLFLTVDSELQARTFNILETALKNALVSRLTGRSSSFTFSLKQLFMSIIDSNNIDIKQIMNSENDSTVQNKVKLYILSVDSTASDDIDLARQILIDAVDRGSVTQTQLILIMHEQGTITGDEKFVTRVKSGAVSPLQVILDKLEEEELSPQMTNMDPCTGSVVVTDVSTGEVLAAVTYPSYDNNEFVNNFNNSYYIKINNDPTKPLMNRPFTEPRAPGSTFKMITAIAGLEEGIITPYSVIHDKGTFTDAGKPYARCWIGSGKGSHGSITVAHALEVSCNYFFYSLSYRMGNPQNPNQAIETLNKYMRYFGLDDFTGVEIYELYDSTKNYPSRISSPEYKKYIYSARNPNIDEDELKWAHGDTIRTAIGQSFNNYTSAILSKYVATLANGGTRYSMHFLDKITNYENELIEQKEPAVENIVEIKPKNLKAVHDGMLLVTTGAHGTLTTHFKDFPIKVAAKSGTAQQSDYRSEHTIFVGFAPYDNPQIAVSVIIPYGNDTTSPAPKVAREVIAEYMKLYSEPESISYNTLLK